VLDSSAQGPLLGSKQKAGVHSSCCPRGFFYAKPNLLPVVLNLFELVLVGMGQVLYWPDRSCSEAAHVGGCSLVSKNYAEISSQFTLAKIKEFFQFKTIMPAGNIL
jgi:hypothetical protein